MSIREALRRGRLYSRLMEQIEPWHMERLSEDERQRIARNVLRELRSRRVIDEANPGGYRSDEPSE